jgi:hypothetical protein
MINIDTLFDRIVGFAAAAVSVTLAYACILGLG